MNKYACRYAIVQFMPYPETGEFANVGVVVAVPQKNLFAYQLETKRSVRLTQFFHHLDRKVFIAAIKALNEELGFLADAVKENRMPAHKAFDLMVRPLEAILRFSHERVKMTATPQGLTQELFERFVQHDFAQHKNYEQQLQTRVTRLVKNLNLKQKFEKDALGPDWYPVKVPMVQRKESDHTRIIHPLYFNRTEPEKIIEHGNLWAGKLETPEEMGKLPEDILIPAEKPTSVQPDVIDAWELTQKRLGRFGPVIEASDEKEIEKFAKK